MKNVLFTLLVLDMLLLFGAGMRMMGATAKEPGTYRYTPSASSSSRVSAAPAAEDAQPSASGDSGNAARFTDAMTNTGGSDAPPGLENAIGGNRPTYEVDINGNPQADNEAALDDARAKIGALGGKP